MPSLITLTSKLKDLSVSGRTFQCWHVHGQPASPTRLGKEIGVLWNV
jgi:adenylosuccinate lyase